MRKINKPIWMKVPDHQINRSDGSRCDNREGNNAVKAHKGRTGKLHQLSLVTQVIVVKLSDMMKPVTLLEATVKRTIRAIRGNMMLRVSRRLRMNVPARQSAFWHAGVGDPIRQDVLSLIGSRICP